MTKSTFYNQLSALLWKCWLVKFHHYILSIVEFLIPLTLVLALVVLLPPDDRIKALIERNDMLRAKQVDIGGENSSSFFRGPVVFSDDSFTYQMTVRQSCKMAGGRSTFIYFVPNTRLTIQFMRRFTNHCLNESAHQIIIEGFNTEDEAINAILVERNRLGREPHAFIVIFDLNSTNIDLPFDFKYTIRTRDRDVNTFKDSLYFIRNVQEFNKQTVYKKDFYFLVNLINEIFNEMTVDDRHKRFKNATIIMRRLPYPRFRNLAKSDSFVRNYAEMPVILGYIIICILIVKRITDEKAGKAKELLRMMGMSDWVFWASHFINNYMLMLIQNMIFSLCYCFKFSHLEVLFGQTDPYIFFVIMSLYSAQAILLCMLISIFFNNSVIAIIVTIITWLLTWIGPRMLFDREFATSQETEQINPWRIISCLLPNCSLNWFIKLAAYYEKIIIGIHWNNLFVENQPFGSFCPGFIILTALVSLVIYGILIWYIDNVWPWQFGVPKPFYFPFTADFWNLGRKRTDNTEVSSEETSSNKFGFEPEPEGEAKVIVEKLHKEFGNKVAVKNVDLKIYEGQITVLLGHNGAGKSTTMNIITGILRPSSGSVTINGYNVQSQTQQARESIGLCPQDNIIYNELTVYQHLNLFAKIYGCRGKEVRKEIKNTLKLLNLKDKKHELAMNLSGGMKRKLMLGMAMIGGKKILIIDEVTSGMDPENRRLMWNLLQSLRTERTILLTTHFMEEADVLGDRIAIMSEGIIKCCGSSFFLKKVFGKGYQLNLAVEKSYKQTKTDILIKKHLPHASLQKESPVEVVYSLSHKDPSKEVATSEKFPNLFYDLEKKKDSYGIKTFDLIFTRIEDVFLEVGHESEIEKVEVPDEESISTDHQRMTGCSLFWQQLNGLMIKRFKYAIRFWASAIFQMLLPALLFILIFQIDKSVKNNIMNRQNVTSLELNLHKIYGNTIGFYYHNISYQEFRDFQDFSNYYADFAQANGMTLNNLSTIGRTEYPDWIGTVNKWALNRANNFQEYLMNYIIGGEISQRENNRDYLEVRPWYNGEAWHSMIISLNYMYQVMTNFELRRNPGTRNASITVFVRPFGDDFNFESIAVSMLTGFNFLWIYTFLMLMPLTTQFIVSSYVLFPINERASKAKLLQIMTGLSSLLYWMTNFIFDLINHFIVISILFVLILLFDSDGYLIADTNSASTVFILLMLYAFSSIPFAYFISFLFNKPTTGFVCMVLIYLFTGLLLNFFVSWVFDIFQNEVHNQFFLDVLKTIISILKIIPAFNFNFSLQQIYYTLSFSKLCHHFASPSFQTQFNMICENPEYLELNEFRTKYKKLYRCCPNLCSITNECFNLDYSEFAINYIYLFVFGIVFMIIVMLLEGAFLKAILYRMLFKGELNVDFKPKGKEDDDVVAERKRVIELYKNNNLKQDAISVINLTKIFHETFTAVNHLTFGVHKNELFGLLGVNGAGKTTTFSMLIGDLFVSEGNAFIGDINMRLQLNHFQEKLGYCPQFDALLDRLTGREMLFLFARLRGVPPNKISSGVNQLIQMVDLQKHADKFTQTYSGGNKRKLSLAMAIIGNPPVVFLDEPTAGVDPAARRKIWSTLVYIQEKFHCSIILTSHSMDECETLCSRIAIMVNGQFKCLGSTQHLRNRFGEGYTVLIKLKRKLLDENPNYIYQVRQHIKDAVPSSNLKDYHQCLMHYHVEDKDFGWAKLFKVMEDAKTQLEFEDYFVSYTTLEQIFLSFAKQQHQTDV